MDAVNGRCERTDQVVRSRKELPNPPRVSIVHAQLQWRSEQVTQRQHLLLLHYGAPTTYAALRFDA